MVLTRRVCWLLIAVGVWSWLIWPTFLRNIWHDPRSWHAGMTAFFGVHLVLTVVSLALGTAVGVLGVRGLWVARSAARGAGRPGAAADVGGDRTARTAGRR